MALIVPDFYQVLLIAAGRKTTHRWPAGQRDGMMRSPRMSPGTEHQVFEHAPHGRYGDPNEPPLLIVKVDDVRPTWPNDWDDDEMPAEGFADLEAYGLWWDTYRVGSHLCKPWVEMQREPFWMARITCKGKTPMYTYRYKSYVRSVKKR